MLNSALTISPDTLKLQNIKAVLAIDKDHQSVKQSD